nr:LOW QUALITY PROTEIN: protein spinster homolog 1-like [Chelonoidis abingdonii]
MQSDCVVDVAAGELQGGGESGAGPGPGELRLTVRGQEKDSQLTLNVPRIYGRGAGRARPVAHEELGGEVPVPGLLSPSAGRSVLLSLSCLSPSPPQQFWLLLLTRGLVGVGEASYSTIAPTIIADLFVSDQRSRMLAFFYFAIPVGSGLGYIVGSKVKDLAEDWHWALRVTPALGVVAVVLLITVLREPPRGAVERHSESPLRYTSWAADIRALSRNRSFVLSVAGFTAVAFVDGVAGVWLGPAFLYRSCWPRAVARAYSDTGNLSPSRGERPGGPGSDSDPSAADSSAHALCVRASGPWGGASNSKRSAEPTRPTLVRALPAGAPRPSLPGPRCVRKAAAYATYVFIFIGETLLSLNWAIVADILLYVVVPTRRSTAESFQIVMSHLLGDAGSPYLIGVISDRIQRGRPPSYLLEFHSLQYALMLSAFAGVLGGGFFLATALFIQGDRKRAELSTQGLLPEEAEPEDRIVVPKRGRSTKVPVSSVLI